MIAVRALLPLGSSGAAEESWSSHLMCRPTTGCAPSRRIDNTMVKAIARAFRWRTLLENGTYATIAEIAAGRVYQ
jgi:hypothetical protein